MGYDIDDILSEVKKRREENEQRIKAGISSLDSSKIDEIKPEPTVEDIEPKVENIQIAEEVEDIKEQVEDIDINDDADVYTIKVNEIEEVLPEEEGISLEDLANQEEQTQAFEPMSISNNEFAINISDEEYQEISSNKRAKKQDKKKKKKIITAIICVILALLIAGGVGTWAYMNNIFNQITDDESTTQNETPWKGMDDLVESFEDIHETDASQISSLQDMIKQWYKNGMPVSSTHVLNVMLIGEDTRGTDIKEDGTRADSAIICSVNVDTHQITLTSILRDTYAYWENEVGDESTGHFNKINGAMSIGNVKTYIEAVENLYKISIDNYVIVNFDSFAAIVDTLGGVEIEMTAKEINEINSHQKRYNNTTIEKTFEGNKGTLKLNGKQALAYCRIRKIDSDNMRANRQKICLNKIFDGVKDANGVQLIKIVNKLVPYVKTDMSKNEIIKVGKYALKQGWLGYKVVNNSIPDSRINERGAGGIFYGTWCWKSDFPQDAYDLQMKLYGKSNITLARTRVDVLNCELNGFYSQGSSPVTATLTNEHYGEVTTQPESTTKEKEE